jgi:hypothetical protein
VWFAFLFRLTFSNEILQTTHSEQKSKTWLIPPESENDGLAPVIHGILPMFHVAV